jgi:hypothetical protein
LIAAQLYDRYGEALDVTREYEDPGLIMGYKLRIWWDRRGHTRSAGRHRLEQRDW